MDMRGDWLTIENGDVRAVISRRGAQMLALNIAGRDLLWKPDVSIWAQTCPVLFPVIRRTVENRIRVNGKTYPMPMHGFAAQSVFSVTAADDESCVLTLRDDAQTLRHYPYPFELSIAYRAEDGALAIAISIINKNEAGLLPVNLGFHPGFRWPIEPSLAKADHAIAFKEDAVLTYTRPIDRLVGPERAFLTLTNGVLDLDEDLFRPGGLLLLGARSRRLTYGARGGGGVTLDYPDFPELLLWARPGSPFLCIEPCRGHADPLEFDGEFSAKPGITIVAPGSTLNLSLCIGWLGEFPAKGFGRM
jgi:galactose mutarotase-like enzyme